MPLRHHHFRFAKEVTAGPSDVRSQAFWQGVFTVTAGNEAVSKVKIEKRSDGKFFYALTFRGVTRPLIGPFPNPFEAAAAGEAALKALEARAGASKA
ncbi:hypothetical protein GB928_017915 [Shinella curvata]|uniref:Uncharacterized protein n=1 Tax=Shinella curvata TaxID=1817964 RepID=A0ABT8XH59_9HYPH|nr:hypothetical protein [Shinella curvata]MCJ8053739.1 hypothetical protein [Shinella curvata]MDO6123071.1 hypothetical protein [Shinella curvata]